jgi:uncharacterized phage protein gp47/JayE
MSWPIPTPDSIASRAASIYESGILVDENGNRPDARSPHSVLAATTRVVGQGVYGLYLQQAATELELWPDTAVDNLERLAGIKGLSLLPATGAICNATMAGTSGTIVPLNTEASAPSGLFYQTTAEVEIGSGPTEVPWVCTTAGASTTLTAGTTLTLVSPIGGLSAQTATVISDGLTPGEDEETADQLRARLLLAWRSGAAAGNAGDWENWARAAQPGIYAVKVIPLWGGIAGVGIAVAMNGTSGPRVPTSGELATIQAYVSDRVRRPTCAQPTVFAATLTPVNSTLHLTPDTPTIRIAATNALAQFFLQDGTIGGAIAMSRFDSALQVASGEWEHTRSAPSADVTVAPYEMAVAGTVAFD